LELWPRGEPGREIATASENPYPESSKKRSQKAERIINLWPEGLTFWAARSMGICMNPTGTEEFYGKDSAYIHNHPCIQTLAPNLHNRLALLRLGCSSLHSTENPSG